MASPGQATPMIIALRRWPAWQPLPLGCLLLTAALHALALWWLCSGPRPRPVPVTPPSVTGRLVATLAPAVPQTPPTRQVLSTPAGTAPPRRVTHSARTVNHAATTAAKPVAASPSGAPATAPTSPPHTEAGQPTPESPVSLPVSKAAGLNNPDPPYPALSQRLGEEGVVLLSVLILANGTVAEVSLQRSSGYPRLDEAALAAVRRWHYQPARRGGVAIDYRYSQPIRFSINDFN